MIAFKKLDKNGNLIFSTEHLPELENSGKKSELTCKDGGTLTMFTDDKDLVKSKRLLGKVASASLTAYEIIFEEFKKELVANNHSLKPIIGQLKQAMGKIVPNWLLEVNDSYSEQKTAVVSKLSQDIDGAAEAVIYLKKRVSELSHHMLGFELVSMGSGVSTNMTRHNVKNLIINIAHAFDDELEENSISLQVDADDEACDANKYLLDYKTIDLAFYNILHNATKYCLVGSKIRIMITIREDLLSIAIQMLSKRIERDEVETIFNRGVRGRNSVDDEGSGMGMFIARLALKANHLDIFVQPDYSISKLYENERYDLNTFYIEEDR